MSTDIPYSPTNIQKMDDKALWNTIQRFDNYINSAHSKASQLIALNTFFLGALVLSSESILKQFSNNIVENIVSILLLVIALASIYSLFRVFQMINPYLESPNIPNKYHSNIFFKDVSKYPDPQNYLDSLQNVDLFEDLAYQVHAMAKGVTKKYEHLSAAVKALIWILFPSLTIIVILKISILFFKTIS